MATITDIARECGVSIATVSMVLNNKGRVGQATRNRVMDAVSRLEYDLAAKKALPRPVKTNTIGLVLPRPVSAQEGFYYRAVLTAMPRSLEYGYDCKIMTQQEVRARAVDNFYKGKEQLGCDAVILFCPNSGWEELVTALRSWKVPVALIRRSISLPGVVCLNDSDYEGGRLAGEHLAAFGHRKVGVVMHGISRGVGADRMRGMEAVLQAKAPAPVIINADLADDEMLHTVRNLMRKPDAVTALFVMGDDIAARLISLFSRHGIRVPEDISVVGYDNDPAAVAGYPAISTVRVPVEEMIGTACRELAMYNADNDKIAAALLFGNEMVVRESTSSIVDR